MPTKQIAACKFWHIGSTLFLHNEEAYGLKSWLDTAGRQLAVVGESVKQWWVGLSSSGGRVRQQWWVGLSSSGGWVRQQWWGGLALVGGSVSSGG